MGKAVIDDKHIICNKDEFEGNVLENNRWTELSTKAVEIEASVRKLECELEKNIEHKLLHNLQHT